MFNSCAGDSVFPEMRTNHIMVYSNDMLILNGGYSHNHYFNDTWYFDIEENRWLEKKTFVHAFYPTTCTDDIETIENDDECVELDFPHPLRRAETDTFGTGYEDVLPYGQQNRYTPDPDYPLYFGIVNDADKFVSDLRNKYLSNSVYDEDGDRIWIQSDVPDGTPIAPYAATAPRQYAKRRRIEYNETLTLDMWEWCTSVEGEPTRDTNLDGKFGRANETIRIHQPRRQTAGWDGCRDLRWVSPPSRSGHKGVLVEKFQKIVVYGGLSYRDADHLSGQHPVTGFMNTTYDSLVVDDMWSYGIDTCPRNCSGVGTCKNGFCKCDPGFYGLDCSNATCPGSVCYYDENYQQHCEHCCYDGYSHSDESHDYIAGVRKLPCRPLGHAIFSGHSNGVCDGFGTCQCIPPYVGEDCSIRDCPDNCNSNGFCNLEFPVARCICKEGYKG
jgi:phosphoribosylformylglycinamidine (FGAM) synthase-like amidotransferase family enzyme